MSRYYLHPSETKFWSKEDWQWFERDWVYPDTPIPVESPKQESAEYDHDAAIEYRDGLIDDGSGAGAEAFTRGMDG